MDRDDKLYVEAAAWVALGPPVSDEEIAGEWADILYKAMQAERKEIERLRDELFERPRPAQLEKSRAEMIKIPPLPNELYEYYPAMSAQTHEHQVKEYVRLAILKAREDALEEAAKIAEEYGGFVEDTGSPPSDFTNSGKNEAAIDIASAIRQHPQKGEK